MRKKLQKVLPMHIGFIMDGNGRWAKKRHKDRTYGHKIGGDTVTAVIKHAKKLGIKFVTFFAFSTENWKRPQYEIDEIMRILNQFIIDNKENLIKEKIRLNILGKVDKIPSDLALSIKESMELTKDFNDLTVNIAIDYGSRNEIINAVNKIIEDKVPKVNEKIFSNYLQTSGMPDPDFVIRTSGEYRLSNFLLFQSAYAELYFPKIFWPAFREKQFDKAIKVFQKRNRRFGSV